MVLSIDYTSDCTEPYLLSIHWLVGRQANDDNRGCMEYGFLHAVDASLSNKRPDIRMAQNVILGSPINGPDVASQPQRAKGHVPCMQPG